MYFKHYVIDTLCLKCKHILIIQNKYMLLRFYMKNFKRKIVKLHVCEKVITN